VDDRCKWRRGSPRVEDANARMWRVEDAIVGGYLVMQKDVKGILV